MAGRGRHRLGGADLRRGALGPPIEFPQPLRVWLAIAANAAVAGAQIDWTAEKVPIESLTIGDWTRSLAWARWRCWRGGRRCGFGVADQRPKLGAGARPPPARVDSLRSRWGRCWSC